MEKKIDFKKALITIIILVTAMFFSLVVFGTSPHIPLLIGCGAAGCVAAVSGYKWDEIVEGMVAGISQSLEAIIILLLIGVLIGTWIISGTVPALIYYGLKIISPRVFLLSTLIISSVVSMAAGSWGTAGTVGLALIGIAASMGIPLPLTAGAIISGAYVGDKLSPLSDSSNLAAAVSGVSVFDGVRSVFPVAIAGYVIAAIIFTVIGLGFEVNDSIAMVGECMSAIASDFKINFFTIVPLLLLLICVIKKIPAIPSIGISICFAALEAKFVQGFAFKDIINAGYEGFTSNTGNTMLDALFTNGGIQAMEYSVSIILIALMFGGVMEKTGQMEALMNPLITRLHSQLGIITATIITCVVINIVLPEQFISIALTGKMFESAFDRFRIKREHLFICLGAGGAATSALVPWNTCGVYMSGILGVSTYEYMPYCFYNMLMPIMGIVILGIILRKNRKGGK